MTPTERRLNQDLRNLAQAGPVEAPGYIETELVAAFRRRRDRRVLVRWGFVGGAVATIAAGIVMTAVLRTAPRGAPLRTVQPLAVAHPVDALVKRDKLKHIPRRRHKAVAEETAEFVALPDADTNAPLGYATVVRLQLPLYALRDIGLAVNEQSATDRVQADVLLGQDGLPRAVRFVQ
ncbi:MAG: hypothetical protein ACR2NN_27650 [Bryobacteraceae bacterium]